MRQCIEAFISDVCAGKDNETPSAYRAKLARLHRWMDVHQLQICNFAYPHLDEFRRSLLDQNVVMRGRRLVPGKLSPFTIHTVLRTVKHFLTWLHRNGHLSFDPSPFRIAPPPRPDPKAVSAENALCLFHVASRFGEPWEQARNLAMLYMLRDTAGRISAILKADIDNVDLCIGKVMVREKGDKPHVLYINNPAIQAILVWLKYRPSLQPKDNTLFISQRGTALKRSGFHSIMMRLKTAACLEGRGRVNAHAFRHAWVRDALQSGEDLSKVSQTLAHSTIRVTSDYYARWADRELKDAHSIFSPGASLPIITPADKPIE